MTFGNQLLLDFTNKILNRRTGKGFYALAAVTIASVIVAWTTDLSTRECLRTEWGYAPVEGSLHTAFTLRAFYDADGFAADTDKVMLWTAFGL